jgi:hypothetical protein
VSDSNDCQQVQLSAAALLDAESATLDREQIATHLDSCDACRMAVEDAQQIVARLSTCSRESADFDAWPHLQQKISSEDPVPTKENQPSIEVLVEKKSLSSSIGVCGLIGVGGLCLALLLAVIALIYYGAGNSTNPPENEIVQRPPNPTQPPTPSSDNTNIRNTNIPNSTTADPIAEGNGNSANGNPGNEDHESSDPDHTSTVNADAIGELTVSIEESFFENSGEAGAPLPFSDEMADDIAHASVDRIKERRGKKFLVLDLLEVYKGRLPMGRFVASDRNEIWMECSLPPRNLGLRSELFKPGSRVLVYFKKKAKKKWAVTMMTPNPNPGWLRQVKRYCDIELAASDKDPAARYQQLLLVEGKGQIDGAAYHAIFRNPSPHAIPVIRSIWESGIKAEPKDSGDGIQTPSVYTAWLLASIHDEGSVESILEHALKQNFGERSQYFEMMTWLCTKADDELTMKVIARLEQLKAKLPSQAEVDAAKDPKLTTEFYSIFYSLDRLKKLRKTNEEMRRRREESKDGS